MKELAEALKEELIKRIKKLRVGPAWEEGVDVGPLINRGHLESVIDYIRIGKEEGAQLAIGGAAERGDTCLRELSVAGLVCRCST